MGERRPGRDEEADGGENGRERRQGRAPERCEGALSDAATPPRKGLVAPLGPGCSRGVAKMQHCNTLAIDRIARR